MKVLRKSNDRLPPPGNGQDRKTIKQEETIPEDHSADGPSLEALQLQWACRQVVGGTSGDDALMIRNSLHINRDGRHSRRGGKRTNVQHKEG